MSKILCPLFIAAQKTPQKTFIVTPSKNYTYLDLHTYAEQLTEHLLKKPIQVAATLSNNLFFNSALLFACLRLNIPFFPLNPKLPPKLIHDYLKESQAICIDEQIFISKKYSTKDIYISPQLPATYLLTSGSTSKPKIAVHSFLNHQVSALTVSHHLNFTAQSMWYHTLPIYHVSGLSLIFRALVNSASLLSKSDNIELDLKNSLLTHISFIPTQLKRLINIKSLKKLSCILLGGAPLSDTLYQEALDRKLPICPSYGLTEMSSTVCAHTPFDQTMTLIDQREIKISKNSEILLKGPTLFLGYLKSKKIISPLNSEGWFETKDLGSYKQNHFTFLGRKDHLFISGGENIQPEEIEQILLKHPFIEEALVVAVPHKEYGHRPIAFLKKIKPFSDDELKDHLSKWLPKYKWPDYFLKLNYNTLKPNRSELKKLALSKIKG